MKKAILLPILMFFSIMLFSEYQPWIWTTQAGEENLDEGYSVAVDLYGNSYITGCFKGRITFGYTTLICKGDQDIFVAKMDRHGNFVWVKQAGGISGTSGISASFSNSIAVTSASINYIYTTITGIFLGTSTFGSTTLTSNPYQEYYEIFVAKLDINGNWLWAKKAGGADNDISYDIANDSDGNSYITGNFFSNSITFGNITLTKNNGYNDIFIAKLDSYGTWSWAKQIGGDKFDVANGIIVDSRKNIFVTGSFTSSSITFGNITLTNTQKGKSDIFVAKLSYNGNWSWATLAGGSDSEHSNDIAIDTSGNSYITGNFYSASITFGSITLNNSGNGDIFVAKLNSSGSWLWANKAGGTDYDKANGISIDTSRNSYITGYYKNTVYFGSSPLTSSGDKDIFIAKMDSNGNWLWAKKAGGTLDDTGMDIAIDTNGYCFMTGYFLSTNSNFGNTILNNSNNQNPDLYISKLDSSGNWNWAKQAQGYSNVYAQNIVTDNNGNSYISGKFMVNSLTLGSITLTNSGQSDIFVAKMDSNGDWLWAKQAGGASSYTCNDIVMDNSGNIYITGRFGGDITFGTTPPTTLSSNLSGNIYIAKMDSNGNWLWGKGAGGSTSSFCYGLAVDSDENCYVTGIFDHNITFGSTTLTAQGDENMFIAKMDNNGNWLWAKQAEGFDNFGNYIAVDNEGNCYACGYFFDRATFGSYTVTSNTGDGIYVAKLDSNGNWLWVASANTKDACGFALDKNGNSYVTGSFYNSATFGNTTLTSTGGWDIFIAKLDINGNWLWAKQVGGTVYNITSSGLTIDDNGNSFISGYFSSSATFGSTTLTSRGKRDIFVARLDSNGNWIWINQAGGTSNDYAYDIAVDINGNNYIVGSFSGNATFGNSTLTCNGYDNIYVAKLHMPYYLNNIPIVEQGISVTVSGGDAEKGAINDNFPPMPNPNVTFTKYNFILDNSISNWTITFQTTSYYGAYYQNSTWHLIYGDGEKIIFSITFNGTMGTVEIPIIIAQQDNTLPVVLSAFVASINSQNGINLMWATQSEANLNGYYLLRATIDDLSQATVISPLIPATNTSQQQVYLFTDKNIYEEGMYYYWLEIQDYNAHSSYYGSRYIYFEGTPNSAMEYKLITGIRSIYPNPFNPSTTISYELNKKAEVKIEIYNNRGQVIQTFALGQKDKGRYKLIWEGKDKNNSNCGCGIYFIRMLVDRESYMQKVTLLK